MATSYFSRQQHGSSMTSCYSFAENGYCNRSFASHFRPAVLPALARVMSWQYKLTMPLPSPVTPRSQTVHKQSFPRNDCVTWSDFFMSHLLGRSGCFGYFARICFLVVCVKVHELIYLEKCLSDFRILVEKAQKCHGSKTSSIGGKGVRDLGFMLLLWRWRWVARLDF